MLNSLLLRLLHNCVILFSTKKRFPLSIFLNIYTYTSLGPCWLPVNLSACVSWPHKVSDYHLYFHKPSFYFQEI